jgi:hypothetical protein
MEVRLDYRGGVIDQHDVEADGLVVRRHGEPGLVLGGEALPYPLEQDLDVQVGERGEVAGSVALFAFPGLDRLTARVEEQAARRSAGLDQAAQAVIGVLLAQ